MAKPHPQPDVLVLGDHPSASFAAALLQTSGVATCHAALPHVYNAAEKTSSRLTMINPAMFDLHELLKPLRKALDVTPTYGLHFLSDEPATQIEHREVNASALVAPLESVHRHLLKIAKDAGVNTLHPENVEITNVDESGLVVTLDQKTVRPKLLMLAGPLSPKSARAIGLPEVAGNVGGWEPGVVHRYTWVCSKSAKPLLNAKPTIPMSLDLRGTLGWGWVLPGDGMTQFAVEQPLAGDKQLPPDRLLAHWIGVLQKHNLLADGTKIDTTKCHSIELPFGGALTIEGVASRTLLIGPAGGFVSACAEEVYPSLWSALFAADAIQKALKEQHPQDALQNSRHNWGATLGDYLRGPQQNLRFLLPLVYRNKVMAARLAEAILTGASVVR